MRIIAGKLGGRHFDSPNGYRTHPMSEKARGALFNVLGDIRGLSVLDAFAGSGALSYEAISRGASHATAIDKDRNAQRTISDNIKLLHLEPQIKLIGASANAWLSTTDTQFDVVLIDPPFKDLQLPLLQALCQRAKRNGVVALSLPPDQDIRLSDNFVCLSSKSYNDNQLVFYRHL